nr:EOG090X0755 [Eulimnadia texana]
MHSPGAIYAPPDSFSVIDGLRKTPKAQLTYERDLLFPVRDFSFLSDYSSRTSFADETSQNTAFFTNNSFTAINISNNIPNVESLPTTKNDGNSKSLSKIGNNEQVDDDEVKNTAVSPEIILRLLGQEELKEVQQQKQQKYSKLLEEDLTSKTSLKSRDREKLLIPASVEQENLADSLLQRKQQEYRLAEELRLQQLTNRIRSIVQQEAEASEIEKLRKEEENKKFSLLQEAVRRIDEATDQFQKTWRSLSEMVKSCVNPEIMKPQITSRIVKLKELNQEFDASRKEAANRDLCVNAAPRCEALVQEIKRLAEEISQIVTEINKQEQLKAAPPPPAERQVSEALKSIPAPVPEASTSLENDYVRKENLEKYNELQAFLQDYEKTYADFIKNPSLKQFRLDCQKAVITPANAISAVSASHLRDKFNKLQNLLQGSFVEVGEKRFSASHQPGGLEFCFDGLAKKFVKLAEDVIPSNPESCFAIAAVVVRLWIKFPVLGRLLLAHLYKACPYLLPRYIMRQDDQSEEEFYRLQGYRVTDGPMEEQDKFLKRMSGAVRLLAAIMITPANQDHPHYCYQEYQTRSILTFSNNNIFLVIIIFAELELAFFLVRGKILCTRRGKSRIHVIRYPLPHGHYIVPLKKSAGSPSSRLKTVMASYFQLSSVADPYKTIFNSSLPVFLVIEVSVSASSRSREESVGENVTFPVERVSVVVISTAKRNTFENTLRVEGYFDVGSVRVLLEKVELRDIGPQLQGSTNLRANGAEVHLSSVRRSNTVIIMIY